MSLTFIYSCKSDILRSKPANEEEAFLQDHFSPDQKWGFLNKEGQLVIEDRYDDARDFSQSLAAVNYQGKWGYIDKSGETIVDYIYKEAHPFTGGFAIVRGMDDTWSVIDSLGSIKSNISADRISIADRDIIKIQKNSMYGFLSISGDTLLKTQHSFATNFYDDYALVKYFNEYRLVSRQGKMTPLPYDKVFKISSNIYRIRKDKSYGYLAETGTEVCKPSYSYASDFLDEMALVKEVDRYVLIDKQCRPVTSFSADYINMEYLGDGLVSFLENDLWGIINVKEEIIAEPIYDMLYRPREGMLAFGIDDLWGFMDTKGNIITKAIFPLVWDYHEGLARVVYPEKAIGFIDKKGELVIPPYFYEIKDYYEGLARVQIYR